MSTAGIKRPLSEEEDSPEYLLPEQPGKDSDEDINSTECLFLMQPVSDGYSSDDDSNKADKMERNVKHPNSYKLPGNSPRSTKCIFGSDTSSTKHSAAEILFFFDMDFMLYGKEIDIRNMQTIDILKFMFEFVSSECTDANNDVSTPSDVIWRNETIAEVYQRVLDEVPILAWIAKHDTIHMKNFTQNELNAVTNTGKNKRETCNKHDSWVLKEWEHFIVKLSEQSIKDFGNHEEMKNLYSSIRIIGKLPPIIQNGEAKYVYNFYIPKHIASDDSGIFESRFVTMEVRPDSIFTEDTEDAQKLKHRIVLEVFSPRFETITSYSEEFEDEDDSVHQPNLVATTLNFEDKAQVQPASPRSEFEALKSPHKSNKHFKRESHYNKPHRTINAIQEEGYAEQARGYLSKRVPPICLESHCMKKLTGQHVLQLLGLAKHMILEKLEKEILPVGIFTKNEYLFLSKVSVCPERLLQILGNYKADKEVDVVPRGKIAFSRFKLDISLPNHRLALTIFLKEYLASTV